MIRDLSTILLNVPIVLIALTFHEFAHGFVSSKLGDPTPKYQGRLTLNPAAHLDPIGTILMILTGFGWAKPVQINPSYYKNQVGGMALTAAAGPLSNFILAFFGMLIGVVATVIMSNAGASEHSLEWASMLTSRFVQLNLCFMVFNLIPIPPLDGFKVIGIFIPKSTYYKILAYERYVIYLIMILSVTGVFSRIIGTGVSVVYTFIFNSVMNIVGLFI